MTYCSVPAEYFSAGLNIIPLRCDGSKAPRIKWKPWIEQRYPLESLTQYIPCGFGVVCGATSGNLECLDFDLWASVVFPLWRNAVSEQMAGFLDTLPIVKTPKGGRHVYYRCEAVQDGRPLARVMRDGELRIIIETRGHGNYAILPGSPVSVHPLRKPYQLIQGHFNNIPTVSSSQRDILLWNARYFNRHWPKGLERKPQAQNAAVRTKPIVPLGTGNRPGDWFNATAQWEEVLEPHGWTIAGRQGTVIYWTKPGSTGNERHATTGYNGVDVLKVFSTSAYPLTDERPYNKFAAYAVLNHDGDFGKAARAVKADRAARIHVAMEEYDTSN